MKRILVILILFFYFSPTFSQTKVESILFNKINDYRKEKNIPMVEWGDVVYKVAIDQTDYMSKTNNCTHDQQPETDHFTNFDRELFRKKFKKQGIDTDYHTVGENCYIGYNISHLSNYEISKKVFNAWLNSPHHHEILLDDDFNFAAVAIFLYNDNVYSSFNCRD